MPNTVTIRSQEREGKEYRILEVELPATEDNDRKIAAFIDLIATPGRRTDLLERLTAPILIVLVICVVVFGTIMISKA